MQTIDPVAGATASLAADAPACLPRERGLPLLGVLPTFLRDAPTFLSAAGTKHAGRIFEIQLGPLRVPVISHPDDVQRVLIDDARAYTKGPMWNAARPLLGNGLVTSEGDSWLRQRRLVQPMFGAKHLASLGTIMAQAIERQRRDIEARSADRRALDVGDEMTLLTQRVLFETVFDTSLAPDAATQLAQHISTALRVLEPRMLMPFVPTWVPLPGGRALRRSIAAIDDTVLHMVRARRAHPTCRPDLLARLLDARDADTGEGMSDTQTRDEVVTMFVGGLDTTAVTLTWMWYLLDRHPAADARLRAEVAAVLGGRIPTVEDLPRLTFTRQVIQESMRLYPPVWIIPREATRTTVLGGHTIAAGTIVIVSPWNTHRLAEFWERPEAFEPERFEPERGAARPKLAYIPFGAGGRFCVGNQFAMMEALMATAMLAQHLRPRLVPGQRVAPATAGTLKPRGGLRMTFEPA